MPSAYGSEAHAHRWRIASLSEGELFHGACWCGAERTWPVWPEYTAGLGRAGLNRSQAQAKMARQLAAEAQLDRLPRLWSAGR